MRHRGRGSQVPLPLQSPIALAQYWPCLQCPFVVHNLTPARDPASEDLLVPSMHWRVSHRFKEFEGNDKLRQATRSGAAPTNELI